MMFHRPRSPRESIELEELQLNPGRALQVHRAGRLAARTALGLHRGMSWLPSGPIKYLDANLRVEEAISVSSEGRDRGSRQHEKESKKLARKIEAPREKEGQGD